MNHDGSGSSSSGGEGGGGGNGAGGGGAGGGWGGMVERVPYNHLIMARKGEEGRTGLVGLCLGVLCVLLEYQVDEEAQALPSEIRTDADTGGVPASGSAGSALAATQQSNSFRYFLAKLVSSTLGLASFSWLPLILFR